ncbi:type II toxin-antitoxin system death-on-curing family toxin [Levilactobacillus lanxiensis]|uniref:Type II toxin-antitoxin system death-on-curing family toxin n=1 Tax=Levilactobacillus lanxiensis TaxID=2799568 RepID=A0ABW4D9V6_9LACO|nr:type II toxin-antitoxin system death-on-curing family toxin [Levilactobacillus lanxiensis]
MTKEDGFEFIDSSAPLRDIATNRTIAGVAFRGKTFSGIIFDCLQTEKQYSEVARLLLSSYAFGNVKSINFNTIVNGVKSISVESNRKPVSDSFIFIQRPLVIPSVEDIIDWNDRAQEIYPEDGAYGIRGVKDRGILEYTVEIAKDSMMFGEDRYPTVAAKSAFVWFRIAKYQAFQNGNKRTAMVAALIMLHSNGYDFIYHEGLKEELVKVSLKIANDDLTVEEITNYICENCKINVDNSNWTTMQQLKSEKFKGKNWEK